MKRLFPSLPETPDLGDTMQAFPAAAGLMLQLTDSILLRDSDLTTGQREIIAAYVSALNACAYCYQSHKNAAVAFDVDGDLIEALVQDPDTAPVDKQMRPILSYVTCLTKTPAMMTEAHAQAVYDAGWSEQALYDAIEVCALFSFMNRIVEGTGVTYATPPEPPITAEEKAARRDRTYSDWGRATGLL
ncbi:MAG: carboxymuconolactone decarboxylase family protein [Paracoccaceae bacterium]